MSSICVYRSSRQISSTGEDERVSPTLDSGLTAKIRLITSRFLPRCRSIHEILRVHSHFQLDLLHPLKNPEEEIKEVVRFMLLDFDRENRNSDNEIEDADIDYDARKAKSIQIMEHILFKHCGYGLELGLIPIFVQYNSRKRFYFQQFLVRVKRRDNRVTLIDQFGRSYKNVKDWIHNNKLPPAIILLPKDGVLNLDANGTPILDEFKTPSCSALPKAMTLSDIAIGVSAVSLGVIAIVGTGGAAIPAVYIGGQIIATVYFAGRGFATVVDKYKHKDKFSNSRRLSRFTRANQVRKTCLIIEAEEENNNDDERKLRESAIFENKSSISWASAGSSKITCSTTMGTDPETELQATECASCRRLSTGSRRSSKYFFQEINLAPPAPETPSTFV